MRVWIVGLVVAGGVFGASPASAQNWGTGPWFGWQSNMAIGAANQAAIDNALEEKYGPDARSDADAGDDPREDAASEGDTLARWSFTPSPARRRQTVAAFLDRMAKIDPAAAGLYRAQYRDPIGTMGQAIAPYGLRTDNLIDAMTVFVTISLDAAQGTLSEGSREQSMTIRRQLLDGFSGIASMSPDAATRQAMAEELLLQSIIVFDYNQQAQGNPAIRAAVRREAAAGLRKIGFDPDTIRLTPDGLALAR